jgi:uncharacterized alpha-E superfamily protein
MLSRVAERMYWAGRYLERAENTSRLVNTYSNLLLDLPEDSGAEWPLLLRIVSGEGSFGAKHARPTEEGILRFLLADPDNPGSLLSSLTHARENFRTSRDIIPREGWECVNELYLMGRKDLPGAVGRRRRFEVLSKCVVRCQQIVGLLSGTMSHGAPYNFLRMGNYLERADMSSRVVDVAAATLAQSDSADRPYENTLWMAVLRSLSAYQMYRQHMRRRITAGDVVGFLLADPRFPRSVAFSLDALARCLHSLPRSDDALRVLAERKQWVLADRYADMDGTELHGHIDQLQIGFAELHEAIAATWFLKPAEPLQTAAQVSGQESQQS